MRKNRFEPEHDEFLSSHFDLMHSPFLLPLLSPPTPFLLSLARKSRRVISQNIAMSLLLAIIGLALAATGTILNLWLAPFYYALGYVVVIANSLRLVRFGEEFSEQEQAANEKQKRPHHKPVYFLAGCCLMMLHDGCLMMLHGCLMMMDHG